MRSTGESQYCAFLLLKALQTVVHTYDVQNRLRATRADPRNPSRANICGLKSLTVSFENLFLGPVNSNINNCRGSCAFPLTNGNNHAVLLKSHTEDVRGDERAPCCVPVAYDPLEVLDWNDEGSFLSVKPNMIAKECGCRWSSSSLWFFTFRYFVNCFVCDSFIITCLLEIKGIYYFFK